MISTRLLTELNDQLNFELYSAHLYLSMAAYFSSKDLDGFANFFKVQTEEERFHAMKLFDYINDMDGIVNLGQIDIPQNEFGSIIEVFKEAFNHEKLVTERIYKLSDIAMEEREHATISLLKWYIDEQIEEESTFKKIIKRLERVGDDNHALYMLDTELSQRTFAPPTNTK